MSSPELEDRQLQHDMAQKGQQTFNSKNRCKTAKSGSKKSGSSRFIKDNMGRKDMKNFYKNGYILEQSKISTRLGTLPSTYGYPYNYQTVSNYMSVSQKKLANMRS